MNSETRESPTMAAGNPPLDALRNERIDRMIKALVGKGLAWPQAVDTAFLAEEKHSKLNTVTSEREDN